jgi:hypothetical protein
VSGGGRIRRSDNTPTQTSRSSATKAEAKRGCGWGCQLRRPHLEKSCYLAAAPIAFCAWIAFCSCRASWSRGPGWTRGAGWSDRSGYAGRTLLPRGTLGTRIAFRTGRAGRSFKAASERQAGHERNCCRYTHAIPSRYSFTKLELI